MEGTSHSDLRWQDSEGPLSIHYVRSEKGGHYRMQLGDEVSIDLHPDRRISANVKPDLGPDTFHHFLADQVIPRALAGEGKIVIHAGAVAHDDGAILLVGASGRGKSTLTTSFYLAGNAMLGDDAIVIDRVDGRPAARAVYPSLRLMPDSIIALVPDRFETRQVADYTRKLRVSVPVDISATSQPLPVVALFVIGPLQADRAISIRRLSIAEACMALVENSFALDPSDVAQARYRLDEASALARDIPSFELNYPHDYARLLDVRTAIFGALADKRRFVGSLGND